MSISLIHCIKNLAKDLYLSDSDITLILSRTKHEGFSFLSKTLPKVSKFLLSSIENGRLDESELTHFKWKGGFPIIFGSLFRRVFHPDGRLREDSCPHAIYTIRQFCDYFYKTVVSQREQDIQQYVDDFVSIDNEVADSYDAEHAESLRKFFATNYRSIHDSTLDDVFHYSRPRFGPGTFSGKADYDALPWYFRRSSVEGPPAAFSSYWAFFNTKAFGQFHSGVRNVYCDVPYNELLFVPKDSRGPRTIVREPASLLRAQMSYNKFVSDNLTRVTSGRVNFASQDVNYMLARESSIDRKMATIDLSSASDRVSRRLMSVIFRHSPLRRFISSATKHCLLPDGTFHKLNKLAGMGSGLTFPSMSLLIHLTITYSLCRLGLPFSQAKKLVYVYGDDIIVPTRYYEIALQSLRKVGLVVNKEKSYHRSHFRESCGGDFYKGVSVSPIRFRSSNAPVWYNNRTFSLFFNKKDKDFFLLSLERHCRELVKSGLLSIARYYYRVLEKYIGPLPYGSGSVSALVRYQLDAGDVKCTTDSTGTYALKGCYVPVPIKDSRWKTFSQSLSYDVNSDIRRSVTRCSSASTHSVYEKLLIPMTNGFSGGVVPRRVRLVRKNLSSLNLAS